MKKQVIVAGNSDFAATMKHYIEASKNFEIACFCVDREYIKSESFCGYPVEPIDSLPDKYNCKDVKIIPAIGYKKMGDIKEKIMWELKDMGFGFFNYIHPSAVISPDAKMGEGNCILEGVIVEAGCSIGNGNIFYGGGTLGHDTTVGNYNTISIGSRTAGFVTIQNHCFLGIGSIIRDRVTVHDYALVGAGSYAYEDIQEHKVLVPARSVILDGKDSFDFM